LLLLKTLSAPEEPNIINKKGSVTKMAPEEPNIKMFCSSGAIV